MIRLLRKLRILPHRLKVRVYLRGGQKVTFTCSKMEVGKNSNGDFVGYMILGDRHPLLSFKIDDISAVRVTRTWR